MVLFGALERGGTLNQRSSGEELIATCPLSMDSIRDRLQSDLNQMVAVYVLCRILPRLNEPRGCRQVCTVRAASADDAPLSPGNRLAARPIVKTEIIPFCVRKKNFSQKK